MKLRIEREKSNPVILGFLLFILAVLATFYWEHRQATLNSDLIYAVIAGEARDVERLLAAGADPNGRIAGLGLNQPNVPFWKRWWDRIRRVKKPEARGGRPLLMHAVAAGDLQILKLLIRHGADVNVVPKDGIPPVLRAATLDDQGILVTLLEAGAKTNVRDKDGQTLLMVAAARSSPEVVKTLIERGSNVTEKDSLNRTAIRAAAEHRNYPVIRLLLDCGANVAEIAHAGPLATPSASPFHRGIGSPGFVRNVRIHARPPVPPLVIASQSGSEDLIRAAWQNGASIHRRDRVGLHALREAVHSDRIEAVRELLDLGVPAHFDATFATSPVVLAASRGRSEILRLLLERGAPVNTADPTGRTPLHGAVQSGNIESVRELLKRGADVTAIAPGYGSPLHNAGSRAEIVELLLRDSKVQVDATDHEGRTPLMMAYHRNAARALIAAGANVNARDSHGTSVILHKTLHHSEEIIKELLENGADPLVADAQGRTPLSEAKRMNASRLIALLESGSDRKPTSAKTVSTR